MNSIRKDKSSTTDPTNLDLIPKDLIPTIMNYCKSPLFDVPSFQKLLAVGLTGTPNWEWLWYSQHKTNGLNVNYLCKNRKNDSMYHACSDCDYFSCSGCDNSGFINYRVGYKIYCSNCMMKFYYVRGDTKGITDPYDYKSYEYWEGNDIRNLTTSNEIEKSYSDAGQKCRICIYEQLRNFECTICRTILNYKSRSHYVAFHGSKRGMMQIKVCGKCVFQRHTIPELNEKITRIDLTNNIKSPKIIKQKVDLWEFFSE